MTSKSQIVEKKKPFKLTQWHTFHLRWMTPIFMTAIGYLYPNPKLWYESLGIMFIILEGSLLTLSAAWEVIAYYLAVPVG